MVSVGCISRLISKGKIAVGTLVDLGRSSLGVAVRVSSIKPDIGSFDTFKRAMLTANYIVLRRKHLPVYEAFPAAWNGR